MRKIVTALALVALGLTGSISLADDWTAEKLRGNVFVFVANDWQRLARGMVVPDTRVIRTFASGRVTLTRGNETIDLGPDTQIQISDKAGRLPYTTVLQHFGTVSIEAEVRQVQHFAVQTPYLAAVVKGTRFVVKSDETNSSVSVKRGHVEVDDHANHTHVTITVGQSASVDAVAGGLLEVAGKGKLPVVLNANGEPVEPQDQVSVLKAAAKAAEEQAKLLKTPEAKAAAESAKKAAQAAEKRVKDAAKDADEGEKDADKAVKDAAKPAGPGSNSGPGGNAGPGGGSGSGSGSSGPGGGDDGGKGKKGDDR